MFWISITIKEAPLEKVNRQATKICGKLDLKVMYKYFSDVETGILGFMWHEDINAEPLKQVLREFCTEDVDISSQLTKEPPQAEQPLPTKMARLYLEALPY